MDRGDPARFGRRTVTTGVKLSLPCVPLLSAWMAMVFLLDDPDAYAKSASYQLALSWMPIDQWGYLWLILAVIQGVAFFSHNRAFMVWALCAGVLAWVAWGAMFTAASFTFPDALLTGVGMYAFIAIAHLAIAGSMIVEHVIPAGRR